MQSAILTIGNFDGVHLGHQMLLRQVVERARALGLRSFAVTFDPHPEQVLFPERKTPTLTSTAERVDLIRAHGLDDVWVCAFTLELSRLEPEAFMRLVAERQPISELWVGHDFALGHGRKGTVAVLAEIGGACGWGLHVVPPYRFDGQVVSSTGIRMLLADGAIQAAAELLGRPYSVSGELIAEDTLRVEPLRALPRPGTYRSQLRQADQVMDAVAKVPPEGLDVQLRLADGLTLASYGSPATLTFMREHDTPLPLFAGGGGKAPRPVGGR